jgi:UDP-2,3-diacylglucosamine hydrolase
MNTIREPSAIFVADTHFHLNPSEAEQKRLGHFLALLELAERADHLVLLGDIFDFWFDYPHFRLKGYEAVLQALDRVRAAGTTIHFIGGNHDIWAADYFHRRYGTSPQGETQVLPLGKRRILLTHGDGQLKFDWAYNTFRAMVRTKVGIVLAKSLHPEILYALSEWLSGKSRGANRDEAEAIVARARRWIARQPPADWDLMIMGHVHHGFQVTSGNLTLASLAGWFEPLGYGLLQDGVFSLRDFATDPPPTL